MRTALSARVSTRKKGQDTEKRVKPALRVLPLPQDAFQRKFENVLFWSLDRFSRETLNHLQRLSSQGVRTIARLERARRAGRVGGRPRLVVDRARALRLAHEGLTTMQIGDKLGISAASAPRILRS